MSGIRLEQVTKRFGRTDVIKSLDLEIAAGEYVVVVGPSGCGKSTLLRLIAGLEAVTSGTIHIGARDVTRLAPAKRGVAMVFQSYALYPHMTAYRNIAFGLEMAKANPHTIDVRVRNVADLLKIGDLLDRRPRELSGGQRQRVAIARAIVREPQILLLDEPLSNLDAALRSQTRLELAALRDKLSATIIHVTHDQLEAMTLADRIVLMKRGTVEQIGTPEDLYHRPATRFAAAFMGAPSMNLIAASSVAGAVVLPSGEHLLIPGLTAHDTLDVGVRAQDVSVVSKGEVSGLTAMVRLVEELGEARLIHAALPDGTVLTIRHGTADPPPRRGETIGISLDVARLHLFGADGRRLPHPG